MRDCTTFFEKSVIFTGILIEIQFFGKYKHFSYPLSIGSKSAYICIYSRSRDLSRAKLCHTNLKRTLAISVKVLNFENRELSPPEDDVDENFDFDAAEL